MTRLDRTSLVTTALALLVAAGAARVDGPRPAPASLDELLEPLRAEHELPALGAAIVARGELSAIGVAGRRRADAEEPVTTGDRWHLGSCTKSMTATWIALLVEQGELGWDTTVGEAFADLRESGGMHAEWVDVPIEWLLQNRGGAPARPEPELWRALWAHGGSAREQRMALVRGVLAAPPAEEPGTKYLYSNVGFSIAAAMAEEILDASYEERIREDLFEPLGLSSFGFGAPGKAGAIAEPFGHVSTPDGWTPKELGPGDDNPSAIAPAGKVHGTLADWAKYAAFHLRGARGEPAALPLAAFEHLHAPQLGDYAMGWVASAPAWAGGPMLWHNGSNTMWYCELALLPEQDLAILVVTNCGGQEGRAASAATLRRLHAHATGG